jgi:hypothetical protein
MLEISEELKSYIEQPAQKVTPRVSVRFSDNRYLENIDVKSSENIYYNYLENLEPKLYWRFFEQNYSVADSAIPFNNNIYDYSKNNNDAGIVKLSNALNSVTAEVINPKVDIKNYKLKPFVDNFNRNIKNNLGALTTPSGDRVYYETTSAGGFWYTTNQAVSGAAVSGGKAGFFQSTFPNITTSFGSGTPDYMLRPIKPKVSVIETGGTDGEVSCRFGLTNPSEDRDLFLCPDVNQGLIVRYVDETNFVMLQIAANDFSLNQLKLDLFEYHPSLPLGRRRIAEYFFPTTPSSFSHPNARMPSFQDKIALEFIANRFIIKINDVAVATGKSGFPKVDANATKHGIGVSFDQTFTNAQRIARNFTPFGSAGPDGFRLFWRNLSINCFEPKDYSLKLGEDTTVKTNSLLNNLEVSEQFHVFLGFNFKNSNNNNFIFQKLLNNFSTPAASSDWNINLEQVDNNLRLTAQVVDASGQNAQPLATTSVGTDFSQVQEGWRFVELVGKATYNASTDSTSVVLEILIDKQSYAARTQSFSGKRQFRSNDSDVVQIMPNVEGEIDFVAIFDKIITPENRDHFYFLYNKSYRDFLLPEFCTFENVFETNEEETFLWSILDDKENNNSVVKVNGYSHLLNKKEKNISCPFVSTSRSSSTSSASGFAFADPPEIYGTFSSVKCNKIKISTGYESSKIKRFEIFVNNVLIQNNNNNYFEFNIDESYKIINLPSNILNVSSVKVRCISTHYPNCPARLFNINMIYEVDVSEDVISLDYNKIRENFESTLPLGVTAANNGDIALDNTHQKYSPYNTDSPYYGLIQPESKVSLALDYHLPGGVETVILATDARVQSWDIDSSGMTVSVSLADDSTVLQDLTADEGFLFESTAAGRAVAYVARAAGVPSRKTKYWDSYQETVSHDSPAIYFPLHEALPLNFDFGSIGLLNLVPPVVGVLNISAEGQLFGVVNGSSFEIDSRPVLKQERGFEANIEARTLNSLYKISPEDVGESAFFTAKPVFNLLSRPPAPLAEPPSIDLDLAQYRNNPALLPPTNFAFEFVFELNQMLENESVLVSYMPACEIKLIKNNNLAKIEVFLYNNNILTTNEIPIEAFLNKHTYVYLEIKNNVAKLSLYNDYLLNILTAEKSFGTVNPAAQTFPASLTLYNNAAKNKAFYGKIAHFAVYTNLLSEERILTHAISTSLDKIYQFPYLYFFQNTYWDGMLEWAAADLGMFYFDEFNNFNYEYKNVFHEPALKRYAESQFSFNEEKHIIQGSHVVDIQTNYINTIVNPQSRLKNNIASVWRAESNDSLAITRLEFSSGSAPDTLVVDNTENPIWPVSGYLKINDEIIKYNDRGVNRFRSLERGALGTKPEPHLAGSLVREVKVYDIEFSEKPVYGVRPPFITAQLEEQRVDVDIFETTSLKARMVLSAANDAFRNNPDKPETNLVILEGKNSLTELDYFTSIAGIPVSESTSQEKAQDNIEKINQNIKKFRKKELIIDNKFIQNKKYAEEINRFVIKYYGYPVPVLLLEVDACPFLQLGDVVTIESFRNLNIVDEKYWVIENKTTYDGGVASSLVLQKFTEEIL